MVHFVSSFPLLFRSGRLCEFEQANHPQSATRPLTREGWVIRLQTGMRTKVVYSDWQRLWTLGKQVSSTLLSVVGLVFCMPYRSLPTKHHRLWPSPSHTQMLLPSGVSMCDQAVLLASYGQLLLCMNRTILPLWSHYIEDSMPAFPSVFHTGVMTVFWHTTGVVLSQYLPWLFLWSYEHCMLS